MFCLVSTLVKDGNHMFTLRHTLSHSQVYGRVTESLPSAMFRVELDPSKQVVLTTISGKIRKNHVRVIVGDFVTVELSAYDLTKGRITFRRK